MGPEKHKYASEACPIIVKLPENATIGSRQLKLSVELKELAVIINHFAFVLKFEEHVIILRFCLHNFCSCLSWPSN